MNLSSSYLPHKHAPPFCSKLSEGDHSYTVAQARELPDSLFLPNTDQSAA